MRGLHQRPITSAQPEAGGSQACALQANGAATSGTSRFLSSGPTHCSRLWKRGEAAGLRGWSEMMGGWAGCTLKSLGFSPPLPALTRIPTP